MAGKKRRWVRILLGLTLALGAVVSLLWWQAHRESERISYLPSTEAFTDSTKYRLTSLREFVPPLPESVQELGRVAWGTRGALGRRPGVCGPGRARSSPIERLIRDSGKRVTVGIFV